MKRIEPLPREPGAPFSGARADIWLPPVALASCIRAVMSRDTRGVELASEERCNYFPASPTCAINWYFEGNFELLDSDRQVQADSRNGPLGRMTFSGPFVRPVIVRNPGPMHAMVLLIMPDALQQLTGIDPSGWVNKVAPVDEVFDADWLGLCRSIDEAIDDAHRVALIESFLRPRWRAARPQATFTGRLLNDWSRSLALRAATSGLGRSQRQFERRIKQWTGQTLRELRGRGRSEQAFFDVVTALKDGDVNWSEVASNNGYADQSHLCRQTRRVTGFAPEELRRRIATEEGFWAYRLWGHSERLAED